MELGICTGIDSAGILQAAGGDYVEVNVQGFLKPRDDQATFQPNLDAVKAAPLPARAANGFIPGDLKSTGPAYDLDGLVAYAEVACARAKAVGIEHIVFGSSGSRKLPDGFSRNQAVEQFVEVLRAMGPIAAGHGVTIVIEPLREAEDNFINTVADGAEFVEAAGHPNIQLLADIYHMIENGESPQDLVKYGPMLRHVHVAEGGTRHYPGTAGDDFRPFFKALKQAGYAGRMSVEGKPANGIETDAGPAIAELRKQLADCGY